MRRGDVHRLRRIEAVRAVQSQAAEMQVKMSGAALLAAQKRRDQGLEVMEGAQRDWLRVMTDPILGPGLARHWSSEVTRAEGDLRGLEERVRSAQQDRAIKTEAWQGSLARVEAARALARQAARRRDHLQTEAALNEIADQFARRGVRS